jgi:hypothetical protein
MKIFTVLKEDKGCDKINPALTERRLKPKSITLYRYGVTTSPWAQVTVILIQYHIF